jgi:hypothetical protein
MPRHAISVCCALAILISAAAAQRIQNVEVEYQTKMFKRWWNTDLVWTFDQLPTEGSVAEIRIPYSGCDYPDSRGGTHRAVGDDEISPLWKYDRAFNRGKPKAQKYEESDVNAPGPGTYGPLGLMRWGNGNPNWHGHCNGWTAASIRHAEPRKSVVRNGVTFTPADIKALLADIYMYCDTEFLGGEDEVINPGMLHVTLTNWIGRGQHPIGMETKPGEVVYNYPAYAYKTSIRRISDRAVEVEMVVTYAYNTNYEYDKSPREAEQDYFHYKLRLDAAGRIVGGEYYDDSSEIDMFWAPLRPLQGGEEGNEWGNPHIDLDEVLSMWRESVPREIRANWWTIDALKEDVINADDERRAELLALKDDGCPLSDAEEMELEALLVSQAARSANASVDSSVVR